MPALLGPHSRLSRSPAHLPSSSSRVVEAMSSSLWLLQAHQYGVDDRSADACSVTYWLRPGKAVVGRVGQADLPIDEDNSISRKHATITVPAPGAQADGEPYVLLKGVLPPLSPPKRA